MRGRSVKNYLELIPAIKCENTWVVNDKNIVIITKMGKESLNKKIENYIKYKKVQKKEVNEKEIELDNYGSIVWQKINGKKKIEDIINEVIQEMGEEKDTACKRAVVFFEMLRVHKLIDFV